MPSWSSHRSLVRRLVSSLWLLTLWGATCSGQTFWFHLHNGDRITGRILSEDTNAVVVTTLFGECLSIPTNLIDHREQVSAPAPNQASKGAEQARVPLVPASGVVGELVL